MNGLTNIIGDWERVLSCIFNDKIVIDNLNLLNRMYKSAGIGQFPIIYPDQKNVFKAFQECPYEQLSVVILLQDPYNDGKATGIALANDKDSKLSPSLRVVKDCVSRTIYKGQEFNFDPTLVNWSHQGILLLNTALSVEKFKPLSHTKLWDPFIELVLKRLSEINSGIIYCLWGKQAEFYSNYIDPRSNTILTNTHPAFSSYKGIIWECDHFIKINKILKENNNRSINW